MVTSVIPQSKKQEQEQGLRLLQLLLSICLSFGQIQVLFLSIFLFPVAQSVQYM